MIPRRFIDYMERSLGRALTPEEIEVVNRARADCDGGKRDTVKAMRAALEAYWNEHSEGAGEPSPDGGRSAPSVGKADPNM